MVLTKGGMVARAVIQRVSAWDHFSALLIRIRGSQWSGRVAWATLTRKAPARMPSMSGVIQRSPGGIPLHLCRVEGNVPILLASGLCGVPGHPLVVGVDLRTDR